MSRTSRAEWKALRKRVLDRDGWRCTKCGKAGRMECDHKIPVRAGGDDSMENCRALCRDCHFARSRRKLSAGEREWAAYMKRFH